MATSKLVLFLSLLIFVQCGYPPIGDEVLPGSVLLPATRRGRYLANIVRRQAVDGTGIKFNKDADRMNAEAKKKVDVLSEELLPYIIAEQERRTTLYKRVMTAIQNGEKGVTIAEIRNKPPLVVRKGLLFRCPSNRAPKEPDGSGIIMCEGEIEPTPVIYDSCLSAEDKDLYVAEGKYFFCNRQRTEGPEQPRTNISTVIGCSPPVRTSLNYTSIKCALEDTDDVVVHYRYYPDRTYKFVTELDPDREVCDHWNPCQIGYIYSLPSPDQAVAASELWRDYTEKFEEYERDEIVPPIAEDTPEEHISSSVMEDNDDYEVSPRIVKTPEGYQFDSVWRVKSPYTTGANKKLKLDPSSYEVLKGVEEDTNLINVKFSPFKSSDYGKYYAIFTKAGSGRRNQDKKHEKSILIIELETSQIHMERKSLTLTPGGKNEPEKFEYKCNKCRISGVMVRTDDGQVFNLDPARWRSSDSDNVKRLEIEVANAKPKDFGTYIVRFTTDSGEENLIQSLRLSVPAQDTGNLLQVTQFKHSAELGETIENNIQYACNGCEVTDVTCNGESMVADGKVSIAAALKTITINIPSFSDNDACVYTGIFKQGDKIYSKVLSVIENKSPAFGAEGDKALATPQSGEPFEHPIRLKCEDNECHVNRVSVNGLEIEPGPTRRTDSSAAAYYRVAGTTFTIYVSSFTDIYIGVYMVTFKAKEGFVTKTVLEINNGGEDSKTDGYTTLVPASSSSGAEDDTTVTSGASSASVDESGPKDSVTTNDKTTPLAKE